MVGRRRRRRLPLQRRVKHIPTDLLVCLSSPPVRRTHGRTEAAWSREEHVPAIPPSLLTLSSPPSTRNGPTFSYLFSPLLFPRGCPSGGEPGVKEYKAEYACRKNAALRENILQREGTQTARERKQKSLSPNCTKYFESKERYAYRGSLSLVFCTLFV